MASSSGQFAAGGWPRPSFRWQFWQPLALKSGPRPSEDFVEAGAETHSLRNTALPILKSNSRLKSRLPDDWEKALALSALLRDVAAPPGTFFAGFGHVEPGRRAQNVCDIRPLGCAGRDRLPRGAREQRNGNSDSGRSERKYPGA